MRYQIEIIHHYRKWNMTLQPPVILVMVSQKMGRTELP